MASLQGYRNSTKSVRCATVGDQIGRMRVKRVLLFLFGWLLLSTVQLTAAHAEMRKDRLTITTASGRYDFSIEVTETEADKAMGLMFRQSLGKRAGMLFPHAKTVMPSMDAGIRLKVPRNCSKLTSKSAIVSIHVAAMKNP